jgi:hypothetical protein
MPGRCRYVHCPRHYPANYATLSARHRADRIYGIYVDYPRLKSLLDKIDALPYVVPPQPDQP